MERRLLVVDDEAPMVEVLEEHFSKQGYRVQSAGSAAQALGIVNRGFEGVVLLDFMLPDSDGLEALTAIRSASPALKVIIVTAFGSIAMAIDAVTEKGAFFVHSKGEESFRDRLSVTVGKAFEALDLEEKVRELADEAELKYSFSSIITQSKLMRDMFRTLGHVVESKVSVLIQGESGTGKELVAKAIHYQGPRKEMPFVAINCAGIPDTLLESELFGYEKGAFTGAYARKIGKFEVAHEGTLFLDEIGEMNLPLQSKILRVLQEKSFERLGGHDSIAVDVRVISATNRNLEKEVREGRFREDLYYRLSVFPVLLPPLRERREDIPLLARRFLQRFCKDEGKAIEDFAKPALDRLMGYHYPGNVRQLENIVSHAVVVAGGRKIDLADLPSYVRGESGTERTAAPLDGGALPAPGVTVPVVPMKRLKRLAIENALLNCNHNVSLAARLLGISRVTIYREVGKGRLGPGSREAR